MEFFIHTLDNGIRLIHKQEPARIAHFGLFVNTGTRDESPDEHGLAHFIEHVIFKGTTKRRAHHILSRLENVGGDLNAYTTKEETVIHASFLCEYYDRTIDLISDIVFSSVFPEKELEKEKTIIIDEINSYKDSPSELIFDDFEEQVFTGHPIGRNILGTARRVKRFTREDVIRFLAQKYHTDQMVISSVGNLPPKKIVALCEKYFGHIPPKIRVQPRQEFKQFNCIKTEKVKKTNQSHCIIGAQAYDMRNENRLALFLLNNLLGGPGMNSRLNMVLRERNGLTYNIESNYTPYTDVGLFTVYFGTDKSNTDKCIDYTLREFAKVRSTKLNGLQLKYAQNQFIGQLAISGESNENQMLSIGKSLLCFEKVDSLEEIYTKIANITTSQILQAANDILRPDLLSYLIYR